MGTDLSRRSFLRGSAGALVLAGAGSALAACGSSGGGGGGTTVTLSAWGNHPEWKAVLEEITTAFAASHQGINVQWQFKPNANYQAAVNTAISGGQAPDIFGWLEGTSIRDGAAAGSIADLTGKVDVSVLTPAARAQVEFDGKTWGCPLAAYTVGIFYQRKLFEDAGITPPTTWDEIKSASEKLTAGGVAAWAMPAKDMILPYFFYMLATGAVLGADGFDQLLKGERKFTDPDLVAAAQLMVDLQPYYNKGFQGQSYAEGKAAFAQGRAAMIIGGSADFAGYKEVNPDVDVAVIGFAAPSGGSAVTVTGMDLNYTVSAKSEHIDQAAQFIGWFPSEECQQLVADKLAIPIRTGVVPSESSGDTGRIAKEMVQAGNPPLPLLLDLPEGTGTLDPVAKNSGIFTGSVSPEQFAAAVQDSMKIS